MKLPKYLIKKIPKLENIRKIRGLINDFCLHTVCESAKCPNIGECFSNNTLTFMILGNICTRKCSFCGVDKGEPLPPDPEEPRRIADAVEKLGLDYVVITSVTRDDLPDGGASHFASTLHFLLSTFYFLKIEVLVPDFQGSQEALETVLAAKPHVLNHNLETAPRLYPAIRPQADYNRSLKLLKRAKAINSSVYTKSGFMVGLGESREEVFALLSDLKKVDCDIVTIGQYLAPSKAHFKAARYLQPEEFKAFEEFGKGLGLKVYASPFVRSSYLAKTAVEKLK